MITSSKMEGSAKDLLPLLLCRPLEGRA